MATTVLFNGVSYSVPNTGDDGWGESLTNYFVAISTGALQKTGGVFSITADVNFGASFGLVSNYFKSRTANIATVGVLRLANTDTIAFRNFAFGGNLTIGVNASDKFVFSADIVANISGTATNVTGVVTELHGGTNQSSYTQGDILYASATNTLSKLAKGAPGQVLSQGASLPSWSSVQAGTKNYLSSYVASTSSNVANPGNGNFETGTVAGWSLAHSTLSGTTPTDLATPGTAFSDGSGGSPADVTLTFTTVSGGNQLDSNYSGNLDSSGASVAGDMLISDAFFIDQSDQAKLQSISFTYKLASGAGLDFSGTSSNSFAVWIYDVTNAAWLQPVGVYGMIQIGGVGQIEAVYQTTANSTQYQIALVNINATPGAYGLYVDEFAIGPQSNGVGGGLVAARYGVSGAQSIPSATTTIVNFDTKEQDTSGLVTTGASWKFSATVTGTYQVEATLNWDGVSGGQRNLIVYKNGAQYKNLDIVLTALADSFIQSGSATVDLNAGDSIDIRVFQTQGGSVNIATAGPAPDYNFFCAFLIPQIQGGGAGGSVISMRASDPTSVITSGADIATWGTIDYDTTASFNASTGEFTVPVSGLYTSLASLNVAGTFSDSGNTILSLFNNGVAVASATRSSETSANGENPALNTTIQCVAGDVLKLVISFNVNSGLSYANGADFNFWSLNLNEPATSSSSSSAVVAMSVNDAGATATITGGASLVTFTATPNFDTNASYDTATGLYTAKSQGFYKASAGLNVSGTFSAGNSIALSIAKNGLSINTNYVYPNSTSQGVATVDALLELNAGDTISVLVASDATTPIVAANGAVNYFNVNKV